MKVGMGKQVGIFTGQIRYGAVYTFSAAGSVGSSWNHVEWDGSA